MTIFQRPCTKTIFLSVQYSLFKVIFTAVFMNIITSLPCWCPLLDESCLWRHSDHWLTAPLASPPPSEPVLLSVHRHRITVFKIPNTKHINGLTRRSRWGRMLYINQKKAPLLKNFSAEHQKPEQGREQTRAVTSLFCWGCCFLGPLYSKNCLPALSHRL